MLPRVVVPTSAVRVILIIVQLIGTVEPPISVIVHEVQDELFNSEFILAAHRLGEIIGSAITEVEEIV